MALSYLGAGTVATGNTSLAPGLRTSWAAGELAVLALGFKRSDASPSTPSGWTLQGSYTNTGTGDSVTDQGYGRTWIWTRELQSGDSAPTLSITSGNSCVARIFHYSKGAGTSFVLAITGGADNTSGTAWSVTGAANPGFANGDEVLIASGINSDAATFTTFAISATGATFGAITERQDSGTTTGQDAKLHVATCSVTGGPSSAAPVYTMTGSTSGTNSLCGSTAFLRIREQANGTAYTKSVAGSSTPSGAIKRIVKAKRTGSVTPTGSLKKFIRDLKAGTITATGAVRKVTKRLLTGSTTASGTLGAIKKIIKALTGSITAAGSIRRKVSKRVLGATSPSGIATKLTRVRRTGVLTAFGGVLKKTSRKVLGSITAAASLVGQFIAGTTLFQITLTGAVTAAGALKRKTSTTKAGVTTAVGALRRKTSIFKAGMVQASSIAKKFSNAGVFSGSITPSGFLDTRFFVGISLAGSITATGGIVKRAVKKTVVGTVTAAGALRRKTARRISGAITIFAFIAKKVTRKLVGSVTATGSVDPNILLKKSVSGQATPAGSVSGSHIPAAPVGAFSAVARALYGFFGRRQ